MKDLDENIQLLAPMSELDFFDTQSCVLPQALTALQAWQKAQSRPMPVLKLAFRVRDMISGWFGVRQIGGFSGELPQNLQVGDMLDFFLVEHLSADILTLTVRDKHLDVMTCVSVAGKALTVTSSVTTHNTFGRFYMLPVAPAHKLIVRSMLKGLKAS